VKVENNNRFNKQVKKQFINCNGKLIDLSIPIVMGILNLTPDSFYDGGTNNSVNKAIAKAQMIIEEGAEIIDIGAFSTRPNGQNISTAEESGRLFPILKALRKELPTAIISVDTFRSEIALKSVEEFGVDIVNDISGGNFDEKMFSVISKLNVPYIMMHLQGNQQTMHSQTSYNELISDIIMYFSERIQKLKDIGVKDIIIDPGFGFSKTLEQNYQLLAKLDQLKIFDEPLLVGVSRKSMIYRLLNITPQESLNGTTVLNTKALLSGANILRVHDVNQAVETVKLVKAIKNNYELRIEN